MAYKRISKIKPHDNAEPIQIRVINKWQPYRRREICYLFVDTHGHAIEAIADLNDEAHFSSMVTVQNCYIVSEYLSDTTKTYMNVVPHTACIKLGLRISFTPFNDDNNIPHNYFNFVSYDKLRPRCNNHLLLTDYIGRMERVSNIFSRENKSMLRITIQDQSGHFIESTLWGDVAFSFDRQSALRISQPVIIAMTSMKVTEYQGSLQLGSTNATTITINPNVEDLDMIIKRFKEMKGQSPMYPTMQRPMDINEVDRNRITLQDLLQKRPEENDKIKFTCVASIAEIDSYRTWFYESCTECKRKVIPKEHKMACPNHGVIEAPRYLYCVNATIVDTTASANVVLFNEPMTTLLGFDCNEMVITKGYTDPNVLPSPMRFIRGKTKIFQLQFQTQNKGRNDSLKVNRIFEQTPTANDNLAFVQSQETTSNRSTIQPIKQNSDTTAYKKINRIHKATTTPPTNITPMKTIKRKIIESSENEPASKTTTNKRQQWMKQRQDKKGESNKRHI